MKDILKGKNLIWLSVAVLSIILLLSVFAFQYGVTDNGELTSRLIDLGLYDCQSASGSGEYATKFGVSGEATFCSTADIPYLLTKLFHPVDSTVSVFIPSFIYSLLILFGFYLLIKNLADGPEWNTVLLSVLCILIFGDTAYTSFLNTPYINAAQFAYLVLTVGTIIWAIKSNSMIAIIVSGFSACLFAGTSKITGWIGILVAIYFAVIAFNKSEIVKKILCFLCAAVILTTSVLTFVFIPTQEEKLYDSVFYGIALNDKSEAVKLGIDEDTASKLSGKASFDEQAQKYLSSVNFDDEISSSDISLHYLKNPSLFFKNMKNVAMNSTMISTDYLGNYRYASGKGLGQTSFFKLYSTFKRRLIPASLTMSLLILIAIGAGAIFYKKKYSSNKMSELVCYSIVFCAASALIAFVLPLIYGGLVQIGFNMFLYNLLFDICIISAVVGGTKLLWIRREALKEKYGVNQ